MRPNQLKQRLQAGETVFGPTCTLGTPDTVEMACNSGFDYVFIDGQHGTYSREAIRESIRAAQTTDVTALVRPSASNASGEIEWILDQGAEGVVCPMVNSPNQAREIVKAAYYPPMGLRSVGAGRCVTHFGGDYHINANDNLLVLVMIEHINAVNQAEAIAAVEGVSGIFIGQGDLALSLGSNLEQMARGEIPGMEAALDRVLQATVAAGKIPGIFCPDVNDARRRAEQGFTFLCVDYEFNIMRRAMRNMVEQLHASRQEHLTRLVYEECCRRLGDL